MKLLLANSFFAPAVGGIENYLLNVGRELVAGGHSVSVLASRHEPHLPSSELLGGVRVHRYDFTAWDVPWGLLNRRRRVSACRTAMRRLLGEERFDVVWARDLASLAGVMGCRSRPPVVYIQAVAFPLFMRAMYAPSPGGRLRSRAYSRLDAWNSARFGERLERTLLPRCSKRIVLSEAKRREISAHYGLPQSAFTVVPAGVSVDRYEPCSPEAKRALRRKLGLPANAFVFLFVGRFSPEKNPSGLLQAFSSLQSAEPVALAMVGPAPPSIAREVNATRLPGPVLFPGVAPEPVEWYQAADAFVLPSLAEGFGQVLLEAMSCALPIAAFRPAAGSNSLATAEIVADGETGILAEYGSAAALAQAMRALAANRSDAARMGERGRARCIEHYSWARVTDQLTAASAALRG